MGESSVELESSEINQKKVPFKNFISEIKNHLGRSIRTAKLKGYRRLDQVFNKSTPGYKEEGFDLEEALRSTNGNFFEVGGPTDEQYWFGMQLVDLENPKRMTLISNLYPGRPERRGGETKLLGRVHLQADATNLPLKDQSIGALFASALPETIWNKTMEEAGRVLTPGGLFLVQDCNVPVFSKHYTEKFGFKLKEYWGSKTGGPYSTFNAVLQKTESK